jgi:Ca-activated chloride channel family protein
MRIIIITILMLSSGWLKAQSNIAEDHIRQGNELYRAEKYEEATAEYQSALNADPSNLIAKSNLGNALYKSGKQDEAIKTFGELAALNTDSKQKSEAFYNKGAIQSRLKKLEESIETYKSSLRSNPDNKEARENLQKALLELKKKNPPPQKQDNKKQQQQQKKQQQSKMSPKEAEQRLKLLQQKEKEVQERMQKEKSKSATGGGTKDW